MPKYILLDTIVDYLKDPSVMVAQDNQVKIVDGKKVVSDSTWPMEEQQNFLAEAV